jgi:hypothetical protein
MTTLDEFARLVQGLHRRLVAAGEEGARPLGGDEDARRLARVGTLADRLIGAVRDNDRRRVRLYAGEIDRLLTQVTSSPDRPLLPWKTVEEAWHECRRPLLNGTQDFGIPSGGKAVETIGTQQANMRLAECLQHDHTRAIHYLQRQQPLRYQGPGSSAVAQPLHPPGTRVPASGLGVQPLGAVGQDQIGEALRADKYRQARDFVNNAATEYRRGKLDTIGLASLAPGLRKLLPEIPEEGVSDTILQLCIDSDWLPPSLDPRKVRTETVSMPPGWPRS